MNILLTGGAGYIGSHAALSLLDDGHKVHIIDNLSTGNEMLIPRSAKFTNCNINDEKVHKVKRSDGRIQDCVLISNGAITTNSNNNELYILNSFCEYEDYEEGLELHPGCYSSLRKSVKLREFQEINGIKTEIKLPYFSEKDISEATPLNKELFYYYNKKLKEFQNKLKENYEYISFK